jgi:hypothetical protein
MEIVEAVLAGADTLGVMPTGSGKSPQRSKADTGELFAKGGLKPF